MNLSERCIFFEGMYVRRTNSRWLYKPIGKLFGFFSKYKHIYFWENYKSMLIFMLNLIFMRKFQKKTDLCEDYLIYDENYRYMFVLRKFLNMGWQNYRSMQKSCHFTDLCVPLLENSKKSPVFTDICCPVTATIQFWQFWVTGDSIYR